MKTFYFKNQSQLTSFERLKYANWLDENTRKWEWSFPYSASRRDPAVGVTIHDEADCVAFALRFKCYKIGWNGLNVVADDTLTTE